MRACVFCGVSLDGRPAKTRACSDACRAAARRERINAEIQAAEDELYRQRRAEFEAAPRRVYPPCSLSCPVSERGIRCGHVPGRDREPLGAARNNCS